MSYANLECKPTIDWREYVHYEKLRTKGFTAEYLSAYYFCANMYEEIYLEFVNRKLYGNA